MEKFTYEQAVELFCNEAQKRSFKRRGTLPTKQFNALVKTMEQHYQTIKVEGRGGDKIFLADEKYDKVQTRKDNRSNNGIKFPFEKELKALTLHYLKQKKLIGAQKFYYSLMRWLEELKIIERKFRLAYTSESERKSYRAQFIDKEILHQYTKYFLDHFISGEAETYNRIMGSVLTSLKKEGFIIKTDVRMGKKIQIDYDENELGEIAVDMHNKPKVRGTNVEYVQLTLEQVERIGEFKSELRSKYGVTEIQIAILRNKKEVKKYKAELKERLMDYANIEYDYQAYGAYIIAGKEEVEEYIHKNLVDSPRIKSIYKSYSLKKAKVRENKKEASFGDITIREKECLEDMKKARI